MLKSTLLSVCLFILCSCNKEVSTIQFLDCSERMLSTSEINGDFLFDGKSEYFNLSETTILDWKISRKNDFVFSTIKNWETVDEDHDFLYNASGKVNGEKAQILFWTQEGNPNQLQNLINGTRNALLEKHKSVELTMSTSKAGYFYFEFDIEFRSGKKGHYLEVITNENERLYSVGYYFLTDSYDLHRRLFFDHLINVKYKEKKALDTNILSQLIPTEICSQIVDSEQKP
jgi:hypothetical protein